MGIVVLVSLTANGHGCNSATTNMTINKQTTRVVTVSIVNDVLLWQYTAVDTHRTHSSHNRKAADSEP